MLVFIRIQQSQGRSWLRHYVEKERIPWISRQLFHGELGGIPADIGDGIYGMTSKQAEAVRLKAQE